jgi:hypothetical protein
MKSDINTQDSINIGVISICETGEPLNQKFRMEKYGKKVLANKRKEKLVTGQINTAHRRQRKR